MDMQTIDPGILSDLGVGRREALALADWYAERDAEDVPSSVLALGHRWVVWFQPSGYRSLALGEGFHRLHVPDLVCAIHREEAHVFALRPGIRPNEASPLWVAPFPGLGRGGRIRYWRPDGGERRPIEICMQGAMTAFDASALRGDDHDWEPECKHPHGVDRLWIDMIHRRWKLFPAKYLMRSHYTLGGLVERLRAGQGVE